MPTAERLPCCVPFCKRTTPRTEYAEWICGRHWALIDKKRRQAYARYQRQWRRYRSFEAGALAAPLWEALKRQAIERAAGL